MEGGSKTACYLLCQGELTIILLKVNEGVKPGSLFLVLKK